MAFRRGRCPREGKRRLPLSMERPSFAASRIAIGGVADTRRHGRARSAPKGCVTQQKLRRRPAPPRNGEAERQDANTPTVVVVLVPLRGGLLISVAPCPARANWRSPAAIRCSDKPGSERGRGHEEPGVVVEPSDLRVIIVATTPDRRQNLVFCEGPPVTHDGPFTHDAEVYGVLIGTRGSKRPFLYKRRRCRRSSSVGTEIGSRSRRSASTRRWVCVSGRGLPTFRNPRPKPPAELEVDHSSRSERGRISVASSPTRRLEIAFRP